MKPVTSPPISPTYPRTFVEDGGRGIGGGVSRVERCRCEFKAIGEVHPTEEAVADEVIIDEEDVQPMRSMKTPDLPSREAIEEHRIDHYPYRSWCPHCIEGAGREDGHCSVESHSIAMISMDYFFVSRKGGIYDTAVECDDPDALKVLVVKDTKSKAVFAQAVPQKGIDEKRFAVDVVVESVLWLGYSQVILKSDNEPAIVKLLKESLAALKVKGLDQASEEHSPPYDPQSNGMVEAAVRQLKARFKTMKHCLESRIGKKIPPKHPVAAWLVSHCAALLRNRVRGADRKTPYERVRMRPFSSRLVCFAEKMMYKDRSKERGDEHKWHQGIFLGMCSMTGQYVIFCEELKVVKYARTVKLVPDESKWDATLIEQLDKTPYSEHEGSGPDVVFQDRERRPEDDDIPRRVARSRHLYIKAEDIRAYGHTVGCPRCDHDRRYGPGRTTKGHSTQCRRRIIEELSKTPEGLRRVQDADERLNHTIAEQGDEQGPHGHGGGDAGGGMPIGNPATPTEDLRFQDFESAQDTRQGTDEAVAGRNSDAQRVDTEGGERTGHAEFGGGDTNDFFNEVNDDMEDIPMQELMKM